MTSPTLGATLRVMKKTDEDTEIRTATVDVKLTFAECPIHGADLIDVDVSPPHEVVYEAPAADRVSVGWSRAYADGWELAFGSGDVN